MEKWTGMTDLTSIAEKAAVPTTTLVALEDGIAGQTPAQVVATLEVLFRGRAALERDAPTRRAWKKIATALGRVRLNEETSGKGPVS